MNVCLFRPLLVCLLGGIAGTVVAAPIPSGLSITGTIALDTANSLDPVGNATQAGTLSLLSGAGPASTTSFSGTPLSISPSSLSGALTETGNGVGALFTMSGSTPNTNVAQTDGLFADFTLSLANTSGSSTFVVTFRAVAANSVAANGTDAFAYSDLSVRDAGNNEVFFTDFRADTIVGDSQIASASDLFSLTLSPGATSTFTALQRQRGGAFDNGIYSASLDAFLELASVEVRNGGGNGVPEPGTIALLSIALAAFGVRRRVFRSS